MLAQRTNLVPVSEIRKMYNKVIDRPNAINLTVGQPDFETPDFIKEAGKKSGPKGGHKNLSGRALFHYDPKIVFLEPRPNAAFVSAWPPEAGAMF